MRKIIVIGPSGSGKSTLAAAIASKLHIPHTELDGIYHQANWTHIDKDEFRRIVDEKTKQDGWVFCGNYFSILGFDFWKKADTIIWCDYSFPLVMSRLLRRTLRRVRTKEELWNGNKESVATNFFSTDSVILWMMRTWRSHKKRYDPIFRKGSNELPGVDLIRLKSPKDAKKFLEHIH